MIELNNENFKKEVGDSALPVLVDFWAPWCGPCRAQAPILETLQEECGDKVKVCKVNTDEEEDLSRKFSIMSIPTLMLFKNGEPVHKAVGLHSLADLKSIIGL